MSARIILLAAGASTRMRGADKLLEPIDGTPLIRFMTARCLKAAATRIVLGPDQPVRRAALEGLAADIVEADGDDGMAASIRAGVKGLKDHSILIALADMPEVTASDMHLLLSLHAQGLAAIIQAAHEDGSPGQPVVFAARYLKHLARLQGDEGARSILKQNARDVALIPLKGSRATTDLDTPEEWAQWRANRQGPNR